MGSGEYRGKKGTGGVKVGSGQERRRARRFGLVSLAEITSPADNVVTNAFVANASKTGLGLYLDKSIKAGRDVLIRLTYFDHDDKGNEEKRVMEDIGGNVLWVKELGNYYFAGISFTAIDEKRHKRFLNYLKHRDKD